jgi:hypothetical protein
LSAVSATSNVVPSMAMILRPASHAPLVAVVATGAAARMNNCRSGSTPSRRRASVIDADFGTCQPSSHEPIAARLPTSRRMTS